MDKELLKQLIIDNQEYISKIKIIERDISFDYSIVSKLNKIFTIIGPRRAGKTFFLFQIIKKLNIKNNSIVFLDFSEVPLSDFKSRHFELLLSAFFELFPDEHTPFFFFDEIQELPEFEKGLKYLLNRGYKIFISGSSAKLFTQEIASILRGKTFPIQLFPLNFKEFLRFKNVSIQSHYSIKEQGMILRNLSEFLKWGGFPEVVLSDQEETKKNLIKSYIDIMLFRDIVERYGLKNIYLVETLFYMLINSLTKHISVNKWYNDFKSQGLKLSKDTIYQYLKYFENSQFIYLLDNYLGGSTSLKKVYIVDNGLYNRVKRFSPEYGKLLENQVFRDCLLADTRIQFFHTSNYETDFLQGDNAIQVCYSLNDSNYQREINGLSHSLLMDHVRKGIIVINDDDRDNSKITERSDITIFPYFKTAQSSFI